MAGKPELCLSRPGEREPEPPHRAANLTNGQLGLHSHQPKLLQESRERGHHRGDSAWDRLGGTKRRERRWALVYEGGGAVIRWRAGGIWRKLHFKFSLSSAFLHSCRCSQRHWLSNHALQPSVILSKRSRTSLLAHDISFWTVSPILQHEIVYICLKADVNDH